MSNYSSVQISCAVPLRTPTTPPPGGLRPPVQQSHPFFDWLNSFSLINIILCFSIFQILAIWKTVRRKSRTHLSELQVANLPWWRVMTSPEEGNLWTSLRYSYVSESFIDKKQNRPKVLLCSKRFTKKHKHKYWLSCVQQYLYIILCIIICLIYYDFTAESLLLSL